MSNVFLRLNVGLALSVIKKIRFLILFLMLSGAFQPRLNVSTETFQG